MANFFNDVASKEDYLGYTPYIEAFNYILMNNNELITPPLVFGIHGKWGTGKTTFMNLIKSRIEKEKKFYTVEINPWEYGKDQNFITIFVAKLYKEVSRRIKLQGSKSGIDFMKAIFKPLKLSLDINPVKVEYNFEKFSFDQQQDVINKFISENFALKESISYILNHEFISKKKIVIFIDDLDRCDVAKVMEVIESIKLIFNSRNCIFFLGCDINYLQSALSNKYKDFFKYSKDNNNDSVNSIMNNFSREYLEKIIQIPFYIPAIDGKAIKRYVSSIIQYKKDSGYKLPQKENIFSNFKKDLRDDFISELIIATEINPRRIKRTLNLTFLNYIFMKFKNIEKNKLKINTKLLAFICILREVYPIFYREKLSNELACRNTFQNFYEIYQFERMEEELKEAPTKRIQITYPGDVKTPNIDKKMMDEIKTNYESEYNLFEVYFKDREIKNVKTLNEELYYIELYISVSNLNTSENDSEAEWGALSQIRSEITGKRLSVFLEMLSENSPAKNFIYWFFNDIYLKNIDEYILGIVKNVNIYRKVDNNKIWIFKFDFNRKSNTLDIIFEWRNIYKTPIESINDIMNSTKYDPLNKKIEIDEETTSEELEEIKDKLIYITQNVNFVDGDSFSYINEEISATTNN